MGSVGFSPRGGNAPANWLSAWPRPRSGFRQFRPLRAPLQKREQAPALHTLTRAASPSAACHAKRLDCASLLALASITRGWLANRYDASRSDA